MSTSQRSAGNIFTQALLALVALGLCYYLYLAITEPYNEIKRERATLDSLMIFAKGNDFLRAKSDSLFGNGFNLDSLTYSPRTGKRFGYALNDTSRVKIYELKDPDSDDVIGTLEPDITQVNAASWE